MTLVTGVGGLPHLDPREAAAFVARTADKYREALRRITGRELQA